MSKQKKTSTTPQQVLPQNPLPLQRRQRASAPTATKRRKFRDVPGVQQALFDKGGDK